ncbi:MAG: lipoate--protein ligase family protein [Actinobacteria bacterium]|nr:MAG: lipoate--protein ligase family protein [Actinomycetota bacterium]
MSSYRDRARPWDIDRLTLSAQAAHDLDLTTTTGRKVRIFAPTAPAIVLGSTQREDVIDRDALTSRSLQVARRRSGGGAVLVDASVVWIDFAIARDDPLWADDIGRSMQWLGQLWSSALASVGIDAEVHQGPPRISALSRAICFCGVGHGEVIVDGRKAIGISQRRTRNGARFQSMLMTRRDDALIDVLRLADRESARVEYAAMVYVCERSPQELVDAVVEQLFA